jgi:uncharacterized UPF0160 family protein
MRRLLLRIQKLTLMQNENKVTQGQQKTIGTHSGVFHADDAMGCVLLRDYTERYKGAKVVRTRDPELLKQLDIVIDVGGVYDPALQRYDHHQKGFTETFHHKSDIKLSASGLVYKHYGKEIIKNAIEDLIATQQIPEYIRPKITEKAIEELYHDCYRGLFVTIDAIDNGIERYPKEVKPKYDYYRTDLASRVGRLNPNWWDDPTMASFDINFEKAMALCKEEFVERLTQEVMSNIASVVFVEQAFKEGQRLDGQVIILPRSCFWKEGIFKVEEEHDRKEKTKFVIFPDSAGEGFRVQAVPINPSSFEFRKGLKEEWRGVDQKTLAEKSGIPDIVFCHHAGFIGGAKSLASTLKMAELSLQS